MRRPSHPSFPRGTAVLHFTSAVVVAFRSVCEWVLAILESPTFSYSPFSRETSTIDPSANRSRGPLALSLTSPLSFARGPASPCGTRYLRNNTLLAETLFSNVLKIASRSQRRVRWQKQANLARISKMQSEKRVETLEQETTGSPLRDERFLSIFSCV